MEHRPLTLAFELLQRRFQNGQQDHSHSNAEVLLPLEFVNWISLFDIINTEFSIIVYVYFAKFCNFILLDSFNIKKEK
jgi:hypothetical protein